MHWVAALLTVACAAVGLWHAARILPPAADRPAEATSAAMGLGMAAMFSPLGDPLPLPVWTAVYLACTAWSAAVAVRRSGCDPVHHLLCSGAMLFMLSVGHSGGLGPASVAAIVLAGYFAWHALRCVDRLRAAAPGGTRLAAAQLGTAVAMSAMLVAMI